MTSRQLYEAIGQVDEDLILSADRPAVYRAQRPTSARWLHKGAAAAVCCALVLGAAWAVRQGSIPSVESTAFMEDNAAAPLSEAAESAEGRGIPDMAPHANVLTSGAAEESLQRGNMLPENIELAPGDSALLALTDWYVQGTTGAALRIEGVSGDDTAVELFCGTVLHFSDVLSDTTGDWAGYRVTNLGEESAVLFTKAMD